MQYQRKYPENMPLYTSSKEKWGVFFFVAMGIIAITYGFFYLIDFLPEKPTAEEVVEEALTVAPEPEVQQQFETIATTEETIALVEEDAVEPEVSVEEVAPLEVVEADPEPVVVPVPTQASKPTPVPVSDLNPVSISIPALGKEIRVLNPNSRSIADLDTALLDGVVRHPDSATLEQDGTVFLFGHSSYLPHVVNKNFQAFNGIKELEWGDTVKLQSNNKEYVYRVERVYEVQATNAEVAIATGEPRLTLVTCNTFGSKDDRYIVEAELIDSYAI